MKSTSKSTGVRLADQMQAFSFLEHVAVSLTKQPTFDREAFITQLRAELRTANRKTSFEQLTQYLSRQLGLSATTSSRVEAAEVTPMEEITSDPNETSDEVLQPAGVAQ